MQSRQLDSDKTRYVVVVGSHTDVGKSVVSATLCYGLGLGYHKLVQAGTPTDSDFVASLTPHTPIIPSVISLRTPTSPHRAKRLESIEYDAFSLPLPICQLYTKILIETAGGLYTPIDSVHCVLDWVAYHRLPVVLVGRHYLGAINHMLLSIEALKSRDIEILGVVMSGRCDSEAQDSEMFIMKYANVQIAHLEEFTISKTKAYETKKVREEFINASHALINELKEMDLPILKWAMGDRQPAKEGRLLLGD